MDENFEVSVEQEIETISMGRPHVVILGAGASRAAFNNGDKNGKKLPLMNDFSSIVGLDEILKNFNIEPSNNFEDTFSDLYDRKEFEKINKIEEKIVQYFSSLKLPDKPTIYDHLILSMRNKDLIATFNWDPFLIDAYCRNYKSGLSLPKLAFLHGNIKAGYCAEHRISGIKDSYCRKCGKTFTASPLLYPVKHKDYSGNSFIENEWNSLKNSLQNAFMITIFGYSGPKTDIEAITVMKNAWGNKDKRVMEQTDFITHQDEESILENWQSFINSHHYDIFSDFYESWIAKHPRRTGEAYINQYYDAKFISDNNIPRDLNLQELWKWYENLKNIEEKNINK